MKHLYLFLLLFFLTKNATAIELKTILVDSLKLNYHFIETSEENKKGLIIFMHGAVSEFKNQPKVREVTVETLLENNTVFLLTCMNAGYDVILPVAHNQYNWLEENGEKFIQKLTEQYKSTHPNIFLSGFSDGGTGAYRFFYNSPDSYSGLIVFNGFPQLEYYHEKVDYRKVLDKKVFFFSQTEDKIVPYEFLLLEYRRQKLVNQQTYFLLRTGDHTFRDYTEKDFITCLNAFELRQHSNESSDLLWIHAPLDAFVLDNVIKEVYPFREKIAKKYGMNPKEAAGQKDVFKTVEEQLKIGNPLRFTVTMLNKEELNQTPEIEFNFRSGDKTFTFMMDNYLLFKSWE